MPNQSLVEVVRANNILKKFQIASVPVPVNKIVRSYGIKVFYTRLWSMKGCMIMYKSGACMLIRRKMEIEERREIMAHELKHYFADEANDMFRFVRKEYNRRERPATVFAACLLVPAFFFNTARIGLKSGRNGRGCCLSS